MINWAAGLYQTAFSGKSITWHRDKNAAENIATLALSKIHTGDLPAVFRRTTPADQVPRCRSYHYTGLVKVGGNAGPERLRMTRVREGDVPAELWEPSFRPVTPPAARGKFPPRTVPPTAAPATATAAAAPAAGMPAAAPATAVAAAPLRSATATPAATVTRRRRATPESTTPAPLSLSTARGAARTLSAPLPLSTAAAEARRAAILACLLDVQAWAHHGPPSGRPQGPPF